ncbi:NUDIX domain-containing protein [Olsenella massiliensis]|uniref:NUDIX domain-containing protein n=1 Tax=Olsenella massiliensis TaxID=1622075 RepID=UPI0009EA9686|nr:NUDIX hydrolase [Olsenella massiliensis]
MSEDTHVSGPRRDFLAGSEPPSLDEELSHAAKDVRARVDALTFEGERPSPDHQSGAPLRRSLALGDDDPRDRGLAERIIGEDVAWKGQFFNVDVLLDRLPDGREARRDVVRHPGAVGVVALTDEGRICLVRQYRAALDRVTVEIPAGKLAPGEDPLEAARRELREETGLTAGRMAFLTTLVPSVGFSDERIHLYMATDLTFADSDPDADEFINVDLVELRELVEAVLDGRIEDAKTVVGALVCDAIAHRMVPSQSGVGPQGREGAPNDR